jgi:urease accessory protein
MLRATLVRRSSGGPPGASANATAVLAHDERHLRRKVIALSDGTRVFVDLPEPVALAAGDALVLEDGGLVTIAAAEEELLEVTAPDAVHLAELAWHIGNRHLPAAISADRILILRDHVIKAMLEGLGAGVREVVTGFEPVRGAYSGQGHSDDHHGHHHHGG